MLAQAASVASIEPWGSITEAQVEELEVALAEAYQGDKEAAAQSTCAEHDRDATVESMVTEKAAREDAECQAATATSQLLQGASATWKAVEDMRATLPLLGIDIEPMTHPCEDLS